MTDRAAQFFRKAELQALIDELRRRDYNVVGPSIDQEAIVYTELTSVEQLPRGWTDEQAPGSYRLVRRDDDAWFGYVVGPHSWKKYLFPPRTKLLTVQKTEQGWSFLPAVLENTKTAMLGVRACELAAIAVQDRVFLGGPYKDRDYESRRKSLFLIAVNCTQAASTCFCTSMNTGPRCKSGFDLALTEIESGFLCEIGSDAGWDVLSACELQTATAEDLNEAESQRQRAVEMIERQMRTDDLPQLLLDNLNHPNWKAVGERCLSCTNCTMVCPTCFCSSVSEVRDLTTDQIDRERTWDSCFNPEFSYLGGTPVRNDTSARYRQWLTHKLGSWHEQFGTSGCVGCGRCITWCPVGIDLTAEVAAMREAPAP
ncbi:MAG: 4Fe-4S dicluster domain-containing protein [Planctomycetes bacterium]|nr:4Fe-4S dicluster domain-containing protein [Planctomycetota bacterium]